MNRSALALRILTILVSSILLSSPVAHAVSLQWVRTFGSAGDDHGNVVAVDGRVGTVYVAGYADSLLLRKYDKSGILLWSKSYHDDPAYPGGLAVDQRDGCVYLLSDTGEAWINGGGDFVLRKLSAAGDLVWQQTWHAGRTVIPYPWQRNGNALGIDPLDGMIYATGSALTGSFLRKHSPDGALVWEKNRADAKGRAVAIDAQDHTVYVAGSLGDAPSGSHKALWLGKFTQGGVFLWKRAIDEATSLYSVEYASGVAVAADRSVYLVGTSGDSFSGFDGAIILRKYRPTGAVVWTRRVATPTRDFGYSSGGVAIGPDGGVFLSGKSRWPSSVGVWLRKYNQAGTILWTRIKRGTDLVHNIGKSLAVHKDGSIYVAGSMTTRVRQIDIFLLKYR